MSILAIFLAAVVVGFLAQWVKGRAGAGWFAIAIVAQIATAAAFVAAGIAEAPAALASENGSLAVLCFAIGIGAGGTLIAVLSLPATGKAAEGATKACPRCAETIKAQAAVCRFCGHEIAQEVPTAPHPAPAHGDTVWNR